jgi:hypothetical protein
MRKDWHGLLKIVEAQQIRNGEVIWEAKNLYNMLHAGGELYLLVCCFNNDGTVPASQYFFGLDNRPYLAVGDLMSDLVEEPSGNGYLRQSVSSVNGFAIELVNNIYTASSQIVTFSATTGSYGPVRNLFLTNRNDNDGVLIATAPLSDALTLTAGDSINLRMSLSLKDTSL